MKNRFVPISEAKVKANSKLAGLTTSAYWRATMPQLIADLSIHYRALQRAIAHQVSRDIIPHQRMDSELLPAFLANPHRIPYDTLVAEYGVDRRYVGAAYLRAYERHLANNPELIPTHIKQDPISKTIPHRVYLTETILRTGMDEAFIANILKRDMMPNTIGAWIDPVTYRKAAIKLQEEQVRIDARLAKVKEDNARYDGTTRGVWEGRRAEKIKAKAQRIVAELYPTPDQADQATSNPTPELLRLRHLTRPQAMPTTVWRPRPSALLLYAHKHIVPLLPQPQAALLVARLHEQAMHVLNHTRKYIEDTRLALTERYMVATLANLDPITLLLPHSHLLPERDIALVHGLVRAHTRHSSLK